MKRIISSLVNLRWPYREDLAFSFLSILFFVVPLAFSFKTYENYETVKFCLFLFLFGCSLVAFASKVWKEREIKINLSKPAIILMGVFIFFGGLAVFLTPGLFGNFFGFYTRFVNGWLFYLSLIGLIALLSCLLDRAKYEFLIKLAVFDALLVAVYGLFQSMGFGLYSGIDAGAVERSPSFLGNPNFSGLFLAVAMPLVLVLWVKTSGFAGKIYYSLAGFFMLWAIVIFASRGALFAVLLGLIALCVLLLLRQNFRKYALVPLSFLFLGIVLFNIFTPLNRPQAIVETIQLKDKNINSRLYVWDIAFQAIGQHPFLGVGLGNFLEYYELHRGIHLADQVDSFDDPHNLFLFQAATGGLVFALSFIALLIYSGWVFIKKYYKDSADKADGVLFAGLAAALLAWAAAASFTPVPIPAFLLLAIIILGQSSSVFPSIAIKVPKALIGAIMVLGVVFSVFALAFLTSEHIFFQANQAYYRQEFGKTEKLSLLAQRICPCNTLYPLYNLGAKIKLYKDSPDVLKNLENLSKLEGVRPALKLSNLYFLLYFETKNLSYAHTATGKMLEILNQNPYNAGRLARTGYYFYLSGNSEKSMLYINAALSLNPKLFPAWMLKARLHQTLGEKAAMLNALEKVQRHIPEDEYIKRLLMAAKQAEDISGLPIAFGANFDRLE